MRILDRYILKTTLSLLISCLLTFLFLYVVIDIFSHLDEILKQRVDIIIMLRYYAAYLPIIFVQVVPIACLLATLYTFGKLNHGNEIIAMRASGLSIFQISKTLIVLGLTLSVLVFWVNDRFVPSSLSLTEKIKSQMESGTKTAQRKESEIITNLSIYGLKNRLFFIKKFTRGVNTMEGITILEHDEQQNVIKKIIASQGVYRDRLWRFNKCITYNFDKNGQIIGEPQYLEEEAMAIPETPNDFLSHRQLAEFMTIAQLDDYIWKLSRSGAIGVIRNFKVELYQRYTTPLTSLVIILLGIPFALMIKKRATGLSSVGISIMVGFLYYVLNAVSIALGKAGILLPWLAVSLSHLVALILSLYLISILP